MGARGLLLPQKLKPVTTGVHQHMPPRFLAEHEVAVVHFVWDATRVPCACPKADGIRGVTPGGRSLPPGRPPQCPR